MGFDAANKVFYGDDARRPRVAARDALLAFVAGKMNDDAGPYYGPLGLSESRQVVYTGVPDIADANYADAACSPVVFGMLAESGQAMPGGKTIGGTAYKGQRVPVELVLDFATQQPATDDGDPVNDNVAENQEADEMLAEYAREIIESGFGELDALGLLAAHVEPDAENIRAGAGRNPLRFRCTVIVLPTYSP